MKLPVPRLTYANVVATLALIIAVGGASAFAATQLGKNSVGSRQLRKNAVTNAKIKNGAVTGAKVNLARLGRVPSAADAQTLAGQSAAQIEAAAAKPHCPAGTEMVAGLCFESTTRTPDNLPTAVKVCAEAGRVLPSEGELAAYMMHRFSTEPPREWSLPYYFDGDGGFHFRGVVVTASQGGAVNFTFSESESAEPFRCVTGPTG